MKYSKLKAAQSLKSAKARIMFYNSKTVPLNKSSLRFSLLRVTGGRRSALA